MRRSGGLQGLVPIGAGPFETAHGLRNPEQRVLSTKELAMRSILPFLIIFLSGSSLSLAQGHMGTPQEQRACSRDAQRFCRQQLGNDGAVQQCLQQNRAKLSKSCQKVFASHGM
jgi:hypothetical protein